MADEQQGPGKVTINGKEYLLSDLSDDAKAQLQSLQYVQAEQQRLNAQVAVFKTAQSAYQRALVEALPKDES